MCVCVWCVCVCSICKCVVIATSLGKGSNGVNVNIP